MKKLIISLSVILLMWLLFVSASAKTVLTGDMDSDGRVTAGDARAVLRAAAYLDALTDEQLIIADVDKNREINAADARKILRCAAGLEKLGNIELSDTVYLNQFMSNDDELELYVAGCETKKQDGFVFKYKQEIFIHDGGHKSTGEDSVFTYLSELRKSLLPEGVSEENENYKLKITVIFSHFHTDHMNTYIHDIIPSPYFEIETVYIPTQSVFENTEFFSDPSICDPYYYSDGAIETKGRLRFLKLLEKYSPDTEVVCLDFGETMQIKSSDGEVIFDMFAPSEDWGTAENAKKQLDLYYNGGASGSTAEDFPKAVVNSNSMWLKVTYGERTMLFTGDVMKKAKYTYSPESSEYAGEAFDVMLSYYAEKCGEDVFDVDIVKFPHHGQVRAEASKGVFEVFKPGLVICTAMNFRETTVAKAQKFWDKYEGCYSLSDGTGLYIHTDGSSVTVSKGSQKVEVYDADGEAIGVSGEILLSY